MNAAPVYDLPARRASRPVDARQIVANIADGIANLDAQIHSLAFKTITEERIAAAERNVGLLWGMLAELRAHLPIKKATP